MQTPTLLRDRRRPLQIVLGGLVPLAFGAVVGVVLGVSATLYWVLAVPAGLGAVLAGFEHQDGWGGADRGLVAGAVFALGILLAHWTADTDAKSLSAAFSRC